MKHALRSVSLFLCLAILSPAHLIAGDRRRVLAVSPPSSGMPITFVGGVLDAGTVAWQGGRRKTSVVRRVVSMRIGEASQEMRGTATVRAFLEAPDGRQILRINGITLSAVPQVVLHHAPVGTVIPYRVEIEVPASAPEGPIQMSIGWEVTTN